MDTLIRHLETWKPFTALVVGDFMLDQLQYGDADRLAPDAPVPVLHVRRTEDRPGGASNLAMDLAALRGRVLAFGATGADRDGERLRELLEAAGVTAGGLVADPDRPTTVKRSLIGLAQHRHPQKMFRVDLESREPLPGSVVRAVLDRFERALPGADVVCVEDYGKGVCAGPVCRAVIELARAAGKPVFVDPARIPDYSLYRGATAITPNRTEAELATGMTTDREQARPDHNAALARKLLGDLGLEAVILTLDRHGALLLARDGEPLAVPTTAREVYDVSGAGDMFLAGLTAARANGIDWLGAVRFANAAAGLEVELFGVEPIPLERVHREVLSQAGRISGKHRTLDQAVAQAAAIRHAGGKVVFTNGCFDILHPGHVSLLSKAAAMGDLLIVGLNSDASVRRLKGAGRPLNTQDDRAMVLGGQEGVGAIVIFDDDTPMRLLEALRPDVLVKGADYTRDRVVGAGFVEGYGGRVALVDLVDGKSTTRTIGRMRDSAPRPAGA
ncbi:MAG: D-glycero-beta-D-manno-heptose 1-phosphate adenylyltransferase [Phycisphaerales bacterium]|nr:D-glycero-beta-D-manno-heptose 1-phosphate adenylyltransferase [Phycisphaerales bacterium]